MRFSTLLLALLIGLSSFHSAEAKSKHTTYASRHHKKFKKYKAKKYKPGKYKAPKQRKAKWGGKRQN